MSGESRKRNSGRTSSRKPKRIGGFELGDKIGQGAMGAVFKARQLSLDRVVALKLLPPSIAKDKKFIERFQREARASGNLNHPHIVQGIDVGFDEKSKVWYFAMEYIDGPTAQQEIKSKGYLDEDDALKIAEQMAEALVCAEKNGIVHRDIKPDNIMLTRKGDAKLADLGLARRSSEDASVTQTGTAVGTPHYIAPEQAKGETDVDIRADIYALGATLFHMVTGQTPFEGDTATVIMVKHINEKPPAASQINPRVSDGCSRLIERMMHKKREQRIRTPADLVKQIQQVRPQAKSGNGVRVSTGPRRPVGRRSTGPRAPIGRSTTGQTRPIPLRGDTTGPRGAVGRSHREAASPRGNAMLPVVGGVVALGLIVIVMMMGSSSSTSRGKRSKAKKRNDRPTPTNVVRTGPNEHKKTSAGTSSQTNTRPEPEKGRPTPVVEEDERPAFTNVTPVTTPVSNTPVAVSQPHQNNMAQRHQALQNARSLYSGYLKRFDEYALAGRFTEAVTESEKAGADGALEPLGKDRQPLVSLGSAIKAGRASREKALTALMDGKSHTFKVGGKPLKGIVSKVTDTEISVKVAQVEGGSSVEFVKKVKIADLPPAERDRLFGKPAANTLDEKLALALDALVRQDYKAADAALTAAKAHPLANRYKSVLAAKRPDVKKPVPVAVVPAGPKSALLVVSRNGPNDGDRVIQQQLQVRGYEVTVRRANQAAAADANGRSVVLISSTVSSSRLGDRFRNVPVPLITWESRQFPELGMTEDHEDHYGWVEDRVGINISNAGHPLAAGLNGWQRVLAQRDHMCWGEPNDAAIKIASVPGEPDQCVIFAYEKGADMPGLVAPARRVGFLLSNTSATVPAAPLGRLFSAMLKWCVPERPQAQARVPAPATTNRANILFVVSKQGANRGDMAARRRLEQMGHRVTVYPDTLADADDVGDKDLLVLSSTVSAKGTGARFRNVRVPVITWEPRLFPHMGMTTSGGCGWEASQNRVAIVQQGHPLAAAMSGSRQVVNAPDMMCWGTPTLSATRIATLASNRKRCVVFAYEKGDSMLGLSAPAKRVGIFLSNVSAQELTADGAKLFDAAIRWCLGKK